jgi:ATP-binding cassette, subfamily F, member 2
MSKRNNRRNQKQPSFEVAEQAEDVPEPQVSSRNCTGVLTTLPGTSDIKIEAFTMSLHGKELVKDTTLSLNHGRRYGLIGANGCGKSTLLKAIAEGDLPLPPHVDCHRLDGEVLPTDKTALATVYEDGEAEVKRLEKKAEQLESAAEEGSAEILESIYHRLDELDPSKFVSKAAELLHGLGFSQQMMNKKTSDLSGGWRMRVALAKALFIRPMLLLLDEPTNHLDLEACVWLEDYLMTYPHILVVISHSQDFLDGVCTNIMLLRQAKLSYWTGNYSAYHKARQEKEVNQMKEYEKQQAEIAHIKQFISSCGTYSNLVKQAKSKQKIIDKMEAAGFVEKVVADPVFTFRFTDSGKLPPPVLGFDDVAFAYSGLKKDLLYSGLNLSVDSDSRISLVGPNGAGKSTLLKLMLGHLTPTMGQINRHRNLKLGLYHQHSTDQLDQEATPVEYMRKVFGGEIQEWRAKLGAFGISGTDQVMPIGHMSDGQRSRVVFCEIASHNPNILLLDEPTNNLDIECIDSLAEAIKAFDGGVVLVSHDFRLISQVTDTIWLCDKGNVQKWDGDIRSYKAHLRSSFKK